MSASNETRKRSVALAPGLASAVLALTAVTLVGVEAALAQAGGGVSGSGGSGGAPLPLLGGTILGQLCAAGGGYALWRRFKRGKVAR